MQATRYREEETEKERLRIEGFATRGPLAEERLKKRMDQRAEQLKAQGEEMVARVHFRKKKTDPKRFRRAKRSR